MAEVTYSEVVELVHDALERTSGGCLCIDAVNTMGISEGRLDAAMRDALLSYDVLVPDGMPLVWYMNAKGAALSDRVYGPYLVDRVLSGLRRPTRVAVVGGHPPVHDWLRCAGERYPNADFSLLYDAPAAPIDAAYVDDCVRRIEVSGAELVFVCLGVPRQYLWTSRARAQLRDRVCLSVGGAFDLISGQRRYAPAWVQRAGLTWLYRISQEPRRLGPRYLKYNSAFIWFLVRDELAGRLTSRGAAASL